MSFDKFRGMRIGIGIDQIGDVALLPQLDGFGFMVGNMRVAHGIKQVAEDLGIRVGVFDKLEAIGSSWILCADRCAGRIVWKGSHNLYRFTLFDFISPAHRWRSH